MGLPECAGQRDFSKWFSPQPFSAGAGYCADHEDGGMENYFERYVSQWIVPVFANTSRDDTSSA